MLDGVFPMVGLSGMAGPDPSRDEAAVYAGGRELRAPPALPVGPALDPPPWPEPVDGAGLLDELRALTRRHVVLHHHADTALALWALGTHAFDAFDLYPRLAITSPQKRCGKSRALEVLGHACARALTASSVTAAAIYGAIGAWRPTLLVDEADTFMDRDDALRGVINSSHARAGAFVLRASNPGREPVRLSTWAPVVVAMIGKPPGTVLDRSIEVPMRRRLLSEEVERLDRREAERVFEVWRRKAARWSADALGALRTARPARIPGLDDRAADNWEPLVALADLAGGAWPAAARAAALALSEEREDDRDAGTQLLSDIRLVFHLRPDGEVSEEPVADRLLTKRILETIHAWEERPWATFQRGRPLGPEVLARMLREFGVHPVSLRLAGRRIVRGYRLGSFADAFARYLPPLQPANLLHRPAITTYGEERQIEARVEIP
jgi:putative DNA primase/helicase